MSLLPEKLATIRIPFHRRSSFLNTRIDGPLMGVPHGISADALFPRESLVDFPPTPRSSSSCYPVNICFPHGSDGHLRISFYYVTWVTSVYVSKPSDDRFDLLSDMCGIYWIDIDIIYDGALGTCGFHL